MKALLVYADGHTELRHDGGGQWWIHNDRYFFGWEVACSKTLRGEPNESYGTVVYVEKPKAQYERYMGKDPAS